MSTILAEAQAEVQKLIRQYQHLKAEAERAIKQNTSDAGAKRAEAEKLASRIKSLRGTISKLKEESDLSWDDFKRAMAEKAVLEERIAQIEKAQIATREHIEQLNRAKTELANLKSNVDDFLNTAHSPQKQDSTMQVQLESLLERTEAEQQRLREEIDRIREQSKRDADILKLQRDAARAQQQMEKEKWEASHNLASMKWRWLAYGVVAGLAVAVAGGLGLMMMGMLKIVGA